jgi:hypothetical protein
MGTNIHFFVEKFSADKDYEGPKGVQEERNAKLIEVLEIESEPRWITADSWEYLDEDEGDEYAYWSVVRDKRFYGGRNYYLFGILAGVRGGESISEPRGVPDDISDAYKEQLKQWEGDAHSKSYFTLKELLDVDWSKYENISEFFETIEKMKQLDTDPEKVRCLFFFDN